ncbi:microsomal glutathione S-transferase 1 isoform X2 [Pseudorca crassidens]|uniref:microsomal glutathione S-transferase 1 isoform X2 n=2 Tax=Delphinidae TaxID=9726 RepID=UPI00352EDD0B
MKVTERLRNPPLGPGRCLSPARIHSTCPGGVCKRRTKIETMVDLTQLMENEVFMAFASYTTIVLSKMMFMSTATAFYRLTRKVFANPEDCASFGKGEIAKKYLRTDDRVERVRRYYV